MRTMVIETFDDLDMKQAGARLCEARKHLRLSQQQVAWRAGYTQANYNALERGNRTNITVKTLYALCQVLRVSSDYVLGLPTATPELACASGVE